MPSKQLPHGLLLVLACVLLTGCDAPVHRGAPHQAIEPVTAVVIPGMPSCCCSPAFGASGWKGKVVAVDPGHGGKETGAVSAGELAEKSVNLTIGLRLAALLDRSGYTAVLTRDSDRAVNLSGQDLNGDGKVSNDDDLQARVDIANAANADILVSIHNNGSPHSSTHGTTTYYCDARPFAAESMELAASLQSNLVASMRSVGYDPVDEGTSDDAPLKKPFGHLFVLGPLTPRVARAADMPGALGETLYLTNPTEARLLADGTFLDAIAQGYYNGIDEYFRLQATINDEKDE